MTAAGLPVVKLVRVGVVRERPDSVGGPESAASLISERLRGEVQEVFVAILLDARHRPIKLTEISRGTLTASLVHPRETFRAAIVAGAAAIVLGHNHPSGNPKPSAEDYAITGRLVRCGELLGIPVLDHVVCADGGGFHSMREGGQVPGLGAALRLDEKL